MLEKELIMQFFYFNKIWPNNNNSFICAHIADYLKKIKANQKFASKLLISGLLSWYLETPEYLASNRHDTQIDWNFPGGGLGSNKEHLIFLLSTEFSFMPHSKIYFI